VDEHVHAARASRQRGDVVAIGQVGGKRLGAAQLARELFERVLLATGQQQVRAVLVKGLCNRAAQAAGGARQQDA
jgi:hypothetical protein